MAADEIQTGLVGDDTALVPRLAVPVEHGKVDPSRTPVQRTQRNHRPPILKAGCPSGLVFRVVLVTARLIAPANTKTQRPNRGSGPKIRKATSGVFRVAVSKSAVLDAGAIMLLRQSPNAL